MGQGILTNYTFLKLVNKDKIHLYIHLTLKLLKVWFIIDFPKSLFTCAVEKAKEIAK